MCVPSRSAVKGKGEVADLKVDIWRLRTGSIASPKSPPWEHWTYISTQLTTEIELDDVFAYWHARTRGESGGDVHMSETDA